MRVIFTVERKRDLALVKHDSRIACTRSTFRNTVKEGDFANAHEHQHNRLLARRNLNH
jgi:hypothetical protein